MSFAVSFEVCTVMDAAHSKATKQQGTTDSPPPMACIVLPLAEKCSEPRTRYSKNR
jgi:pyrimidine deaminase RibD-like protein